MDRKDIFPQKKQQITKKEYSMQKISKNLSKPFTFNCAVS